MGRVVEVAPTAALFDLPPHLYTDALLAAIPVPDPDVHKAAGSIAGDLTWVPAGGCSLAPRGPSAAADCAWRPQQLDEWDERRLVACHRIIGGQIQPVPVLQYGAAAAASDGTR